MATAKMKIILPLVVWVWLHLITTTTCQSFGGIGFGIKREVFFLNLEDGYFGCQVNESTDVLQLFELSKLCDGKPNCYLGSDELAKELKCTDDCRKEDGTECQNGACLDGQCYCNDGYGGCSCEVPDENECKYRPCDVFAHCTNTLGSFSCTCFPGYHGDGFHCEDINECDDPAIAARCVENAECCNLPAHFLCKCKPGFQGDGEAQCLDIDECQQPNACGQNALCQNSPGNYTCICPEGFFGNPYDGCVDVDECEQLGACGPGATCTNVVGGHQCHCAAGYQGDPYTTGCVDLDECVGNPCGLNALCSNLDGSYRCSCPPGHIGDPMTECSAAECNNDLDCSDQKACINFQCVNPCNLRGACGENAQCKTVQHRPRCSCPECHVGSANVACIPDPNCLETQPRPAGVSVCFTDADCDSKLACNTNTGRCYDPCENQAIKCQNNKKCEVHYHKPTCVCKSGFMVNERGEISCAPEHSECTNDHQCPSNKSCINNLCQNPCTATPQSPCPADKGCDVLNHKPICICLDQCSPTLSICLRDNGCPIDQACRAFRCENPCDTANCPENTPCRVEDHKPICEYCPPGFKPDPKFGCFKDVQCRSHSECSSQQSCINRKCQNPCLVSNPCINSHDCQVQDHQPVCVKVCQCQRDSDCAHLGQRCDGCNCVIEESRNPQCSHCPPGIPCDPFTGACLKVGCTTNEDCPSSEACINRACQRPCDVHNPCAQNALCINTNHGCDCSCEEGFQGDGFVGCTPVIDYKPVCQYNEDCPPNKLCDRLNRVCINPCFEDSCGENAECIPKNHGTDCRCLPGYEGNAFIECSRVQGCRSDDECPTSEACINSQCISPCTCGVNAICEVLYHKALCKCPPGYQGDATVSCQAPINPCDPNPCGTNALCELDNGNPICFCPKGLTGNPFSGCIPEGDECRPNPCGPNSGCRVVGGNAVCFCLPEFEGTPPQIPCALPANPCEPSPCGPNTQCAILPNGFAKCTCLPGFLESTNTIRGCVEAKNPCEPNPCGQGALCDPHGEPVCYCPYGTIGNPFRSCAGTIEKALCSPGPCGVNADCYVSNNEEQCYCRSGFIGNPYTGCRLQPPSPCVPNPCGPGAQCIITPDGNSMCRCPEGMGGDPTGPLGCFGYECVVDENCGDHQACISYRCRDPCPGSCGVNSDCRVEKHHPVCTCKPGLTGNPVIRCFEIPKPLPQHNPCMPNPCGPNTVCQVISDRATCSCLPDFHGDPQVGCQPECYINSDCPINKACLNRHCVDPCATGHLCGVNAACEVRDHTASCICIEGYIGDPFLQCIRTPSVVIPTYPNVTTQPCAPSPCGSMECSLYGTQIAICDPCLGPDASYNPQCRPECLTNADCSFDKTCLRFNCIDPCPGSCGVNALCTVVSHTPICSCPPGLVGDPFQQCSIPTAPTTQDTCADIRCGANADCLETSSGLACVCKKGFFGDPWLACRPECVINPDCPLDKACINSKCENPCVGVCGVAAQCDVVNHLPICYCPPKFTGDPFVSCYEVKLPPISIPAPNPCDPSPCGPFSRCLVSHQGYATCSCLPNYQGVPPACQPECIVSSECPQMKACINQKCSDPCPGTCGAGALCTVINHNPICSCPPGQQGDPFVNCYVAVIEEPKTPASTPEPINPCSPSPCGPFSICQVKEDRPVCSCVSNYIGSPPYCRPECVISSECPQNNACVNEKCVEPCIGTCGPNAKCDVVNHTPFCSCHSGYKGDAFVGCTKIVVVEKTDPCNPSPCAENAQCSVSGGAAKCTCILPYIGNPYSGGCRPECTMNSECPSHLACLSLHCRDPCQGLCGYNAECSVFNHVPVCTCARGLIGDPQTSCREPPKEVIKPCEPSPCGPNSVCRERNDQAICSCQVGYFGAPPRCRPECLVSSECSSDKACINQKCQDPCPGTCGIDARCQVNNHNPICSCPPNFVGDPFVQCRQEERKPERQPTPCIPSPCGANAECQTVNNRAVCSCLPGLFGAPPNCRPECTIDQDCPLNLACTNQKCRDPCVGSCGFNAECNVVNHRPICSCQSGYEGDPFSGCSPVTVTERPATPCSPSPCGPNAECREKNGAGACYCAPGFEGDPYDSNRGCRRECEVNSDCAPTLACVSFKCVDPCPGTCGGLAECHVNNHVPTCICPAGYTGDPFFQCRAVPIEIPPEVNPCQPSPCGPNSQCREVNNQAVCSCLPQYIGSPPNCRPECIVNSECQLDKACINQKCSDPCTNTCGLGAQCTTRNHSPICACPPGFTGDPFTRCSPQPVIEEKTTEKPPSCHPSPCGPNSQCRIVGSSPSCSCLPDHIGAPPNCRPECVLSSECGSSLACINNKCKDPCPGSCGSNAVCSVLNHIPICSCQEGYTGDPFTYCNIIPATTTPRVETDPCHPSPCGPNAECNNGVCSCLPEYSGNPYEACRPECILSTECTRDKACIKYKCVNPCPGTCGQNARCDVINHIPTCSCPDGYTGDPFINCRVAEPPPPKQMPCNPSPCGPNSQCREINEQAVCSCLQGYLGSPPGCKPECVVSAECPQNRACINQKCIDPCPGSCGVRARCEVRNHSPICSCAEGQTGNPFQSCTDIPPEPVTPAPRKEPCTPSPCGPNSVCKPVGETYACSCLPEFIGSPPNCRPECVINTDCPTTKACINQKCKDPCPGSCGENAECHVISHAVSCSCLPGFIGDPFVQCIIKTEPIKPCEPSPCGANAECKERNGVGACICLPDYLGNPYEGCRPECVLSSDCASNKACIRNKCVDPCPGTCGQNAECSVIDHVPVCSCIPGFTGDAFKFCSPLPPEPVTEEPRRNPCIPSPCGPNSQCREVNQQAVCSCLPEYQGSPPACKPECTVSSECPSNRACHKFKCANPCVGTCGVGARCEVINHNPICSCPSGFTGDPFTRCYEIPPPPPTPAPLPPNPCVPSPCGPNSECRDIGGQPSCSCRPNYTGVPPNCRPECVVNTDCPSHLACITEKCKDPCPGSCGFNAECRVQNHIPICSCLPGFTGNAFTECTKEMPKIEEPQDPCNPSPCGQNAQCNDGICSCLPLYLGDPYVGCRPECTMNTDCSPTKTCINLKCVDPCPGTCGQGAICDVVNHLPICSCPPDYEGDPFTSCRQKPRIPPVPINPCQPSPCGPNSVCRVNNGVSVCSCQPGMIGSPPQCRPECVLSAECALTQACLNNKCIDPCPGTCGVGALCQVVNHNPICSCSPGNTGDPFTRCYAIPPQPLPERINPCDPSPCGPNAKCQVRGESPACSCLEGYVGAPPSCRPECTINPECPSARACINQKCRDPCPGSCGANALCSVVNHNPVCSCTPGFTGDPFRGCIPTPPSPTIPPEPRNPCYPSPCGPNAHCRTENDYPICECLPEFHGNPYESCRPECLANSDCPRDKACIRNKCQDPCPGTCGVNALCSVTNHVPVCTCPPEYTGDAFRLCTIITREPTRDPCNPSPCGINTICRTSGEIAVCECVPGFFGNPNLGGCRPECTVSSDCPRDKACVNTKCVDPCPGVCGFKAICNVINHSPVCSCPTPLVGDPFTLCAEPIEEDPCSPSPCRANGQCRVVNGAATCIYPECVINPDCPRDKACYFQKCQDPCRDACGLNALCQVVNHQPVCSCPAGFTGTPEVQCRYLPPTQPKPKVECEQDSDCTNDKACINNRCLNPCSTQSGICGQNAECRAQLHRAICICREGYTGNAQHACVEIGCRSDSDCAPIHACVNRECVDPCLYTSCGINALCRADGNHKARCYCPENFRGNPLVQCDRPECTTDQECPYNLACRNERCQDPCDCGPNAICNVINHRGQCSCPPGYVGNPLTGCKIEPIKPQPQCKMDSDCPSKLACFGGICKNPCIETKPCGKNAECSVVDTLPLRTMSCICLPGFIGDADVECRPAPLEEPGCKSNEECTQSEVCINRQCVNPCVGSSPCAPTAECQATNHKAVCKCPLPLVGNPFIRCYEEPRQPKPECVTDSECSNDKACINQRCQDPCALSNPCGTNAECQTRIHRPTCVCPFGWSGNPQVICYKPECKLNEDCPYDKACINENCINPCSTISCGRGAECLVLNHHAQCQCPRGTQGDPLVSCITGQCRYNEDCADHEACDPLNRVCRPVCEADTCAISAQCIGRNHQSTCHCPVGTVGDPFRECKIPPRPECIIDADCPSQLACINELCQNPCHQGDYCSIEQECRVVDSLPLRTIMCVCPSDQVVDPSGHCKAIVREQPQCAVDSDCADSEKCYRGTCVNACRLDTCGVNALCRAANHLTQCSCAPGYTGNPRLECTNIPKVARPQPECTVDDECPYDKACRNNVCVNPCRSDKPCGSNAFCSVNRHQPVCRCPEGYIGRPEIDCVAPTTIAVGCTTNSDCPLSESCINKVCISPCNCGPNADCRVVNHYATCFCQAGYSGNPQIGCVKLGCSSDSECSDDQQCYNRQCINPCILNDPCARNAECFGRNHRATCRCPAGYEGDPFVRCERLECYSNQDCPNTRACIQNRCVNPCSPIAHPPCAQNAICTPQNHAANCICPDHIPEGNPLSYCLARTPPKEKPLCEYDSDCPSKLACIREKCVNPCDIISPCHPSAHCSVIDTIPVRTMACTCPEGWVPNDNGECHAILIPIPPGCSKDNDCLDTEACINRICRNPCDCGINAICDIRNHKPICSCKDGFEGNPNIACRTIGCRIDSECDSGTACINGQCVNPCLVKNPCGSNAECYVNQNRPECRCLSGYRGNPFDRCLVVGCVSNSECPNDRQCINAQCINPCVFDNPCSPRAECLVQNHIALCKCPPGLEGNPYVDCKPEPQPECREDGDCPSLLACINSKCQNPCLVIEPCQNPAKCQVVSSLPVRTMNCVCPPGYISSGSGTCKPVTAVTVVGACTTDSECPSDRACFNGICRNPCNCGPEAECRIKDHKPICTCKQGFEGNPEIECHRIGCLSDDECSGQHACRNRQCVPVCLPDGKPCGEKATCYGINHRAICDCLPGFVGNPQIACVLVGCRSDSECPSSKACINNKCENPCVTANPCDKPAECKTFNHIMECICPPGTVSDGRMGCLETEEKCKLDHDCPSGYACIGEKCVNPCAATEPCGINAECTVINTEPVRTMICECLPGYHGNAAVKCERTPAISECKVEKGYIRLPNGECACPPNTALNENDDCVPCPISKGLVVDERGRCVCALEKGLIIDERGNCVCPTEFGYRLDAKGNCIPVVITECKTDDDCPDHKYCNLNTKTCDNPCLTKRCGVYALCNATNHKAVCQCIAGYSGNPEVYCNSTSPYRTDFPAPEMLVSCLSDGVQVEIHINEQEGFNGVLYVKGHSKDEQCRRVLTVPPNSISTLELFKVKFGNCGLIHVNGKASFVLVIQKHPKLVTYKAQAYHIQCVYQTGEQNVTLGFNVSMLTTAGTIANTGPPPTCIMKIVTPTGQEISSAEIGDSLILQVDVQPGSIYGGFARSCVAKTMEDSVENEYLVTDENGCATDPSIFGEWEYNPDTQSLLATFNAFKFPSSDNIRFQCNIRVCFGKCQPVNCRGYNAFGRRKRAVTQENNTNDSDDLLTGQLREEITIQSNAILTLEKKDERRAETSLSPDAQRTEDICVSMIGFIISLIITALLALVAVAVAVSCWLMAYRRRPKAIGPLPHPPEFPNPLFTSPERMAEPSPDYLT